jgi:predicted DsbA family dithiol-disulfide isomerase
VSNDALRIRIDIVSDVVCPWCIIGYKQLEQALSRLEGEVEADIHWHPFELNPMMPPEGQNLREHIAEKYGTDPKESPQMRERLRRIGASLGFSFTYSDDMRIVNTFRAHQLLFWAEQHGKKTELELALFERFFSKQENVDDPEVLAAAAEGIGLDRAEAVEVLADARYAADVREQQRFWLSQGIQAVPSFILERRHLIPGAQDADVFVDAIERLTRNATDSEKELEHE